MLSKLKKETIYHFLSNPLKPFCATYTFRQDYKWLTTMQGRYTITHLVGVGAHQHNDWDQGTIIVRDDKENGSIAWGEQKSNDDLRRLEVLKLSLRQANLDVYQCNSVSWPVLTVLLWDLLQIYIILIFLIADLLSKASNLLTSNNFVSRACL